MPIATRALAALAAAAALALPFSVQAAPDDRPVRVWAAACAACHGTDGHAQAGMTSLAGRNADELYTLLIEFKRDVRPATVMHQHANGYTDEELQGLAQWFAAQAKR